MEIIIILFVKRIYHMNTNMRERARHAWLHHHRRGSE